MDTIRLFAHSARLLIRSGLAYPRAFFQQTLAQLVMMGGELMAVLMIIDRFQGVGQWTGGDLLFLFGLMTLDFYLCEFFFRGITNFSPLIQSGRLDAFMVRPRGILIQILCAEMDIRRLGSILIGVVALLMGASLAHVRWTATTVLTLLLSTAGTCALILGLFLIEAIFCVFSVRSIELVNALTYGGRSACQYPIDIYPRPLRVLFTVVAPFALTLHVPAAAVLQKPLLGWPAWAAFLTPLVGFAVFILMYQLFRLALRKYRSTGS